MWPRSHPCVADSIMVVVVVVVVVVPRLREALTEPARRELYEPTPFVFIALVTATMAVVFAMPH